MHPLYQQPDRITSHVLYPIYTTRLTGKLLRDGGAGQAGRAAWDQQLGHPTVNTLPSPEGQSLHRTWHEAGLSFGKHNFPF